MHNQDLDEESEIVVGVSCESAADASGASVTVEDACIQSQSELMDSSESDLENSWFKENNPSKRQRDSISMPPDADVVDSEEDIISAKRKKGDSLPAYPSNKTLVSQGSKTVVLISQELSSQGELLGVDSKKFTLDPLSLSKGLKPFVDFSQVKDVRVNKRRNIVAVEFLSPDSAGINSLLATHRIGPYRVRCYQPSKDLGDVTFGVIGPIHLDVDLEEALLEVSCEGYEVLRFARLNRFYTGVKELSQAVKVTFSGNIRPQTLKIGFTSFPVRRFDEPIARCYRCQRQGHIASGCSAPFRCYVCGANHKKDQCTAPVPKCVNCQEEHVAGSRDCIYNKESHAIQALMSNGLNFEAARHQVVSRRTVPVSGVTQQTAVSQVSISNIRDTPPESASGLQTIQVAAEVHQSQGSYYIPRRYPSRPVNYALVAAPPVAVPSGDISVSSDNDVVASAPVLVSPPVQDTCVCAGDGGEALAERLLTKCQEHITVSVSSLFSKLSSFLLELFSANLFIESKNQRQLLLIGMVRNHFGPDISEPLLLRHLQSVPESTRASSESSITEPPLKANPKAKGSQPLSGKSAGDAVSAISSPAASKAKIKSTPKTRASTRQQFR